MIKNLIMLFAAICTLSLFSCATGPARLEMDYGTSYKLQKFSQTVNPQAGKTLEMTPGLDAPIAQIVVDKYRTSFEKAPPAQIYNFTIGTVR